VRISRGPPAARAIDAAQRRKSWKRIGRSPARNASDSKMSVSRSRCQAVPSSRVKTRPVSACVRLLTDGLRVGSVMDATVEDLGYDSGHRVLYLTRKGGHPSRVAIPPAVGEAIDAMLAERGNPVSRLLFVTEGGRPLYPARSFRLLKRLGRIASVPQAEHLSAHSMRATAITELPNAGVTLRDVQDFVNHEDPRTTRRYDKQQNNLDRSGAYVLATRYGRRHDG
jgi:integrase/recombinase XerD